MKMKKPSFKSESAMNNLLNFIPPDIPSKNLVEGALFLWKILAVYCMGVLFISRMPWYLIPIGWAMVAAAFSGCLLVGMDCSRSCFFENKAANELIGAIVLLPLLRSVESLRQSKDDTSAWLSRSWACLKTSMSEKRNGICITLVIAAGCAVCWYKGVLYLVKYWLVPFLYMHLSVGSFKRKSTERYSYFALFPDVKQWAEMEKGMLEAIEKACEYIPVYNVKLMHAYIEQQVDLSSINRSMITPSTIVTRLMVLRGKRDAILAVAAFISLLVFKSTAAIGLAVLCFGYCVYSFVFEARRREWLQNLNVAQSVYITGCHVLAIWGIYMIPQCQWPTLLLAVGLWPLSGFGITGGAHRLWAHRSYEASLPFRLLLLFANAIANQGTIYRWSRDHRVHHMCSETDADPHNAKRGFFFAHMGWLYLQKDPKVVDAGSKMNFDDLLADPIVSFQHRCDPWLNMFMCFILPSIVPWYFWNESLLNGYLVPGALRYVWTLHSTWCVNSVAHMIGERPYDPKINPTETLLVSILAVGEGWHNWHHTYPYDYAASELGVLSQYNPTKLVIDLAAWLGLVWNRKRATAVWKATQERRVREHLRRMDEGASVAAGAPAAEGVEKVEAQAAEVADPSPEQGADAATADESVPAPVGTAGLRLRKPAAAPTSPPPPEGRALASLTVRELRQAIPAHCFQRSAGQSLAHLGYDAAVAVGTGAAAVVAWQYFDGGWGMAGVWPLYWWYQGLNGTALWVLAHECGHQAFSDHRLLNDAVGFALHSFLLTPYFSWALTHAKHHRRTNNLDEGETWVPLAVADPDKPKLKFYRTHTGVLLRIATAWTVGWYCYLFTNASGAHQNRGESHFDPKSKLFRDADRPFVVASNAGMVVMLLVLAGAVLRFGLAPVLLLYAIPQMITNIYLVSITFMQHTHVGVPHMNLPDWSWLGGALSTVDRSMGPWVDGKLHHIVDSHVVHHLFPDMPFYGAKEATPYIAQYLTRFGEGVYKSKQTGYLGYWCDFYFSMKDALVVVREPDSEIYWFR